MTVAALVLSVAAALIGAWSLNAQRNVILWMRDGCPGRQPAPWQLRYRRKT